jgi:hypothetical protein
MLLYIVAINQVVRTMLVVKHADVGKPTGCITPYTTSARSSNQASVPTLPKASIWCLHDGAQTAPLLLGTPNSGGKRGPVVLHTQQS